MESKELRIGNKVLTNNKSVNERSNIIKRVTLLDLEYLCNWGIMGAFDYIPIPITEEILLKCGFENNINTDDACFDEFILGKFSIGKFNETDYVCQELDQAGFGIHISYLHQLQNLYFALTGEELEANL